jgi:hypothetical protein
VLGCLGAEVRASDGAGLTWTVHCAGVQEGCIAGAVLLVASEA